MKKQLQHKECILCGGRDYYYSLMINANNLDKLYDLLTMVFTVYRTLYLRYYLFPTDVQQQLNKRNKRQHSKLWVDDGVQEEQTGFSVADNRH